MATKDYFSLQAEAYARFRPRYPPALFSWLARQCDTRQMAWEAGCGSGQATGELARHFAWVVASDPSRAQLSRAPALPNVEYRCTAAERADLADRSVDLILVAQALHWFDLESFYRQVRRVLRPAGLIAVLCYDLIRISREIDAVVDRFYHDLLGDFWPPERLHIEQRYRSLSFPFEPLEVPDFPMRAEWTLDHLLGYLDSWSAVQLFRRQRQSDPLAEIEPALRQVWGETPTRPVTWPLTVRVGRLAARTDDFSPESRFRR